MKKNKIIKHSKKKSREQGIEQGQYDGRFRNRVHTPQRYKRDKYKKYEIDRDSGEE